MAGLRGAGIKAITLLALLPLAVLADFSTPHELRIAIDDGTDDSEMFVSLTDTVAGVDLHSMQIGESRSIVGPSGRSVLLTRVSDGLELNIDGRVIELPDFTESQHFMSIAAHGATDVEGHAAKAVKIIRSDTASNSILIASPDRIDPVTRDGIRALLASAGHTAEVSFVDSEADAGESTHQQRRIMLIK